MTEEIQNREEGKKQVKHPNVAKTKKLISRFFLISFIVIVGFILLLQTSFVRNYILQYAIGKINENLAEKDCFISTGKLEGNIFKGIKLNDIKIIVKKDTMVSIGYIEVEYVLDKILRKNVRAKNVILSSPEFNFTKVVNKKGDTLWNFAYMLESEEKEKDTAKEEFDWKIYADNVEIINGNIKMIAEKNSDIPFGAFKIPISENFNPDKLEVSELNLKLSAEYLPDEKTVTVNRFSMKTNSDFNLVNLSFTAGITKNDAAEIQNLSLRTGKSNVNIKLASLENLNPFKNSVDYGDFENKSFVIDLLADKFDFEDLIYFIKDLNFMGGKVYVDLKTEGNYKNFNFDRLIVGLEQNSRINLSGRVMNLNAPEKLYFDVKARDVVINPKDKEPLLRGIPIPDYTHLGIVSGDIEFTGEPLNFEATADIRTSAGNARVRGSLDLRNNRAVYAGIIDLQDVNIGKIIKNPSLESKITGNLSVEGNGFDYRTLDAKIDYKIENTVLFNHKISSSNGKISASNGNYILDVDLNSSFGNIRTNGNVNIADLSNISYKLEGSCRNTDISAFTGREQDRSNLNFSFNINGNGTSPDNIRGDFNIEAERSQFADYLIPSTFIKARVSEENGKKLLTFYSDFADLTLYGNFLLTTLSSVFADNLDEIMKEIKNKYMPGSRDSASVNLVRNIAVSSASSETDFTYNLNIKNLMPLYMISKDSLLTFTCNINGRVSDNNNRFTATAEGDVRKFSFGDSAKISFSDAVIYLNLNRDKNSSFTGQNLIDIKTDFSKIYASDFKIDTVSFKLNTSGENPYILAYAKADTNTYLRLGSNILFSDSSIALGIDTVNLKYFDYFLKNRERLNIAYTVNDALNPDKHTFNFIDFTLYDGNQKLDIKGYYDFNGYSDLTLSADRINIAKLQLYNDPKINKKNLIKGNVRRVRLNLKGEPKNPQLNAEVNTDMLSVEKMKLGRLDVLAEYKDNNLAPVISFYNPNNAGYMKINGNLPLKNPLAVKDTADENVDFLESKINLKISSNDFQMKILEQFIPVINNLNAKLNGMIDITGKVKNPLLTGNLTVNNGAFNLAMTGVRYNFDALLATNEQKLDFSKFKIYTKDEPDKVMNMSGYLDFTNLTFNDIELVLQGKAKLLDDKVTENIMGIYGNLYGRTGANPIILKGNTERLNMTGDLEITEGKVLIVPQQKVAYEIYSDDFIYKTLIDSSSYLKSTIKDTAYVKLVMNNISDSISSLDKDRLDPFDRLLYRSSDTLSERQSKGIFKYSLKMKTLDNIFAKLIVEPKTRQEFEGYVDANITFDNLESSALKTRGRVDIGNNSFYKFYKSFKAEGYVLFTGDITNPELFIKSNYETSTTNPEYPAATRIVNIKLDVTGNALKPDLKWQVYVNGSQLNSQDPSDDAISFILFGKLKDELNANQRMNMVSTVGVNVGTSLMSSYLSSVLSDYIPFLLKTDISYKDNTQGDFASNTDIRFTAEIAGATIKFGGQILKDLSNTNFSVEYPFNRLLNTGFSHNIILFFERYIDPFAGNDVFLTNQRTGGGVFYRIKF